MSPVMLGLAFLAWMTRDEAQYAIPNERSMYIFGDSTAIDSVRTAYYEVVEAYLAELDTIGFQTPSTLLDLHFGQSEESCKAQAERLQAQGYIRIESVDADSVQIEAKRTSNPKYYLIGQANQFDALGWHIELEFENDSLYRVIKRFDAREGYLSSTDRLLRDASYVEHRVLASYTIKGKSSEDVLSGYLYRSEDNYVRLEIDRRAPARFVWHKNERVFDMGQKCSLYFTNAKVAHMDSRSNLQIHNGLFQLEKAKQTLRELPAKIKADEQREFERAQAQDRSKRESLFNL